MSSSRAVLVGCGSMARTWVRVLLDRGDIELVGLVDIDGEACAICIFELSNGAVFCYRGSWVAEGAPTSWEASWRVVGSAGTAIWDGQSDPYAEVVEPGSEGFLRPVRRVAPEPAWEGRDGHAGCIDEMLAALRQGRPSETDCTDNLKSIAMLLGAVESARLRQKISLSA